MEFSISTERQLIVDPVEEYDREFPAQYARKLVYTIQRDEHEADKADLLASPDAREQLIRRDWADGGSDWYARTDNSWPTKDDLIEPRSAACLQLGYFNELIPLFAPAAIDRVLPAVSCLEGRVIEDRRIELVSYLQNVKRCDQSDAFAICYRVAWRGASMLKDNQSSHDWFVLGRELGVHVSPTNWNVEQCNEWFEKPDPWRGGMGHMAHGQGELGPESLEKRRWYGTGSPHNSMDRNPTAGLTSLADGWKTFPLPSVQRIELFFEPTPSGGSAGHV